MGMQQQKLGSHMAVAIEGWIRKDIGGDEQRVLSAATNYSRIFFLHLLLPVWIGAYQFQGKVYHVVVNARTAAAQGFIVPPEILAEASEVIG